MMKKAGSETKHVIKDSLYADPCTHECERNPNNTLPAMTYQLFEMFDFLLMLCLQHWPGFALNAFSNEAYLDGFVKVCIIKSQCCELK
jgi:hypothetical protein